MFSVRRENLTRRTGRQSESRRAGVDAKAVSFTLCQSKLVQLARQINDPLVSSVSSKELEAYVAWNSFWARMTATTTSTVTVPVMELFSSLLKLKKIYIFFFFRGSWTFLLLVVAAVVQIGALVTGLAIRDI